MKRHELMLFLERLTQRLLGVDCNWAVTGGAALLIHNMQCSASDVDILADEDCAKLFYTLLSDFAVTQLSYSEAENVRSLFARYAIDGVSVEVMSNVSNRLSDGKWHLNTEWRRFVERISVNSMVFSVMSLEYERRIALLLGQSQKASRIESLQRSRQ